jgi:hypothetical protein
MGLHPLSIGKKVKFYFSYFWLSWKGVWLGKMKFSGIDLQAKVCPGKVF